MPFEEALLPIDGETVRLADRLLRGKYAHQPLSSGEDHQEYVVPVEWEVTRERADAYWVKGMFANQNSACKLRNRFTLEQLYPAFGLGD